MRKMQTEVPYPIPIKWLARRLSLLSFFPPDIVDSSGRSVLEGRSYRYKLSDSEKQNCRYRDCRLNHAKPMNLGAMKAFAKNKPDIFDFITLLNQHVTFFFPSLGERGLHRLWALSYVGWSIPFFFNTHHYVADSPTSVPTAEASFAKMSHGLLTLIKSISEKHDLSKEYTGQELYSIADADRKLVGKIEVCAAPPNVIVDIIDFILQLAEKPVDRCALDPHLQRKIYYARIKRHVELTLYYYEIARTACSHSSLSELSVSYCFPYWKDLSSRFQLGQLSEVITEISALDFPKSEDFELSCVESEINSLKLLVFKSMQEIGLNGEVFFLDVEQRAIKCLNGLERLLNNIISGERIIHTYTPADIRNFTHGRAAPYTQGNGQRSAHR